MIIFRGLSLASVVVVSACRLSSAVALAQTLNLVANPSAEVARTGDSSRPVAWTPSSWGTNAAVFTYADQGATGMRSLLLELTSHTSGDAKWVFDSVAVLPGTRYIYQDTFRSTVNSSLVAAYSRMDGTMAYATLKAIPASAAWTSASAALTAPADAARLTVFHLLATVGRLQIDDVRVSHEEAPDLSRGVPNGDLEQHSVDPALPLGWRPSSWGTNAPEFAYANVGVRGSRGVQLTMADYTSGDAKWVFDAQPVQPGTRYVYSDVYACDAESFLVAEIRARDGGVRYLNLGTVPQSATFAAASAVFSAPFDAASATVFHGLRTRGTLTLDEVALAPLPPIPLIDGVPNGDAETAALPGAALPASWSRNAYGNNDARFSYPSEGHGGSHSLRVDITSYVSGRAGWYFDAQSVTGGGAYRFRDFYRSDADTTVTAEVWLANGTSIEQQLPPAFATASWSPYGADVFLPPDAVRLTIHHQLGQVGFLQTDDFSLLPATSAPFARGLVSLTFDDGWRTDYDNVLPILDARGVVATHFVATGFLGESARLTSAMVQALAARGDEIGSHTIRHPDLRTLSPSTLNAELATPKSLLASLGVGPTLSFASPYGAYNAATLAAITSQYRSHRTTDVGYNWRASFDVYALKVQNIRTTTTTSEVDAWAARAAASRSWLILVYHDVADPPTSVNGTTPANLDAHIRALQSRGLAFLTVRQALDELVPQLP